MVWMCQALERDLVGMWARFDALLAELALLGVRKDDNERKARSILFSGMSLVL